jgi:hypothetical protein
MTFCTKHEQEWFLTYFGLERYNRMGFFKILIKLNPLLSRQKIQVVLKMNDIVKTEW